MIKLFLSFMFFISSSSLYGNYQVPESDIISFGKEIEFPLPELLLAISKVESSCNPKISVYDKNCKCRTYGLMQIQLDTARTMGFTGKPLQLLHWETNLTYGSKYLLSKLNYYQDIPTAISAYNAGTPLIKCNHCTSIKSKFTNGDYVLKVLKVFKSLLKKRIHNLNAAS